MHEINLWVWHVAGFMPVFLSIGLESNNIVRLILQILHDPAWNAAGTIVGLISLRLAKKAKARRKVKPSRSHPKSEHRPRRGRKRDRKK